MDKEKAKKSVKFITGKYENYVGKDTYIEGRIPKGKAVAVIAIEMIDIDGKDPELLANELIEKHILICLIFTKLLTIYTNNKQKLLTVIF